MKKVFPFTMRGAVLCATALASLSIGATESAAQESFRATHVARLSGAEARPPAQSGAVGLFIMQLDTLHNTLSYRISVAGIDSIVSAHFVRSNPADTEFIVHAIPLSDSRHTVNSTWSNVSAGLLDSLKRGFLYVNIRSRKFPLGEIRGQITLIPNATAPVMTPTQETGHTITDTVAGETGQAYLWINESEMVAAYHVWWSSLSGPAVGAHFHAASAGSNGPIVHDLNIAQGDTSASGVWVLTPEQLRLIKAGGIYVNVHTVKNSEGELRGQVFATDAFTGAVSPVNEVPSLKDSSTAAGTALFGILRVPPLGAVLTGTVVAGDFSSAITAVHLHAGMPGDTGAVLHALDTTILPPVWSVRTPWIITPDTVQLLGSSGAYVEFHTMNFPGGEARGELVGAVNNLSVLLSAPNAITSDNGTFSVSTDRSCNWLSFSSSSLSDGNVEIFNAMGMKIGESSGMDPRGTINISSFPTGTYFARLVSRDKASSSARFVVIR